MGGCTHNIIDYILIKRKWRDCATNCRAYPHADVGSDHQLLIVNLCLKLKAGRKSKPVQKFDIGKLMDKRVAKQFRQASSKWFELLLAALNKDQLGNVKEAWNQISGILTTTLRTSWKWWREEQRRNGYHLTLCLTDARRKLKPNRRASSACNRHYNFLCCEKN